MRHEQHGMSGVAPSLPRHGWELFSGVSATLLHVHDSLQRRVAPFNRPSTPLPRDLAPRGPLPRPRARRNRALVETVVGSLECIALNYLQRGGLLAGSRALGPTAHSTASRYAAPASRISPLTFSGDKRGQMWLSGTVATSQERPRSSVHVLLHLVQQQLFRFSIGCPVLCCKHGIRPILSKTVLLPQNVLRDKVRSSCRCLLSYPSSVSLTPRWPNGEDWHVECAGVG